MGSLKLGIFGGAFNPVHNGHISLCKQCGQLLGLDKILLVPSNLSPHKQNDQLVSFDHRFNMLKLATKGDNLLEVSDIEYRLGGTSYTYNTIMSIKQEFIDNELYLIIGSDMLKIFHEWYNCCEILEQVTLVVGARNYNEQQEIFNILKNKFSDSDKIKIASIDITVMSSTQIRNCILTNSSMKEFVNPLVYEYIKANNLYSQIDKRSIELLAGKLSKKRYNHTLAVTKLACELAEKYNICESDAWVAAMLHDVTKEYNLSEQLQILNKSDIILDNTLVLNSNLIHSITASIYAGGVLSVKNKDILDSIRYHTTGRANMSMLEKIIYVADACAYDRQYVEAEFIRKLAFEDIDEAMLTIIEFTLTNLVKKREYIAVETIQCYNYLVGENSYENDQ